MKLIKQIQYNIAETSVGASALRSQGASGVITAAREYFKRINLSEFASLDSAKFSDWLDMNTEKLRKSFPKGARNSWGGARKAINLFLRSCLYNTYLHGEYHLEKKEYLLEVPLDRTVATGLYEDASKIGIMLPKWDAIKRLKKEDSDIYQNFACSLAFDRKIARVHLDLYYWRRQR